MNSDFLKNRTRCPGCRKKECDGCLINSYTLEKGAKSDLKSEGELTEQLLKFPSNFQGDLGRKMYGGAVDIGTTSVAVYVYDLMDNKMIGFDGAENPQIIFGNDVMSRLQKALESEKNADKLQRAVTGEIQRMLNAVLGSEKEKLQLMYVCGNPAMMHLFLHADVSGLSRAPFSSAFYGIQIRTGKELGFSDYEKTMITTLPLVGGHVGADAVAAFLCAENQRVQHTFLVLDLGTNGEIILQRGQQLYGASAAGGPAFEGSGLSSGMRAGAGAIDQVYIENKELKYHVIGDTKPKGICGSGLIDALAAFLELEIIDETGLLIQEQSLEITQKDIRQLQLTKGAIQAAVTILLDRAGISAGELEYIYLAGAFGNCINPQSAARIGLIPQISADRIITLGNGAATGTAMAMMNQDMEKEINRISRDIIHVELAQEKSFNDIFMDSLNFLASGENS